MAACSAVPLDDESWQRVRADMIALSSDDMAGRDVGSDGYEQAAALVAARFAELGLKGFGGQLREFHQPVPLIQSTLEHATLRLVAGQQTVELSLPDDFTTQGGFGSPIESVTAPLVFVGYGISAPDLGHDDYAEADVRGQIVIVLSGAPPAFGTSERAYYSSLRDKQALAQAHGAAGLLIVQTPVDRERSPWARVARESRLPDLRWRDADGSACDGFPALPTATLSPQGAERLFAAIGIVLDDLFEDYFSARRGAFVLGATATLSRTSMQSLQSSPNVLAILPGADARLRNEVLLVSAHLDHLGVAAEGTGDLIFNGAYDNAAGIAVMLEVARSLARSRKRLRRSVIFAAYTAEERGLRGSDYLARHPPVPIESIVANLNIDMPYLGFPIRDVEGYGASHSTLEDALSIAARETGLSVSPDPRPELVRLIRSDQYSFVRQGVPGMNLKPGSQSSDPTIDGPALLRAFLTQHYHQPSDDVSLPFSQEAADVFTRTAVTLASGIANAEERPRWRAGDFFGSRFAGNDGPVSGPQEPAQSSASDSGARSSDFWRSRPASSCNSSTSAR